MRVLVVKTSSMGDVIHTLPALTDAARVRPELIFDWVVEEGFAEIPAWHPAVENVIPVAIRRWRQHPLSRETRQQLREFKSQLGAGSYDLVIDAQGLLKSAWVARQAGAPVCGLDKTSAREPLAALAYHRKVAVAKNQHAVERVRQLFAAALGYDKPECPGDFGLTRQQFDPEAHPRPAVVFLHGTTWENKHYPDVYWAELARLLAAEGYDVQVPWSNDREHQRATRLAAVSAAVKILPRMNLGGLAKILAAATAAVAVDTGLGHLAAALNVPMVSLYGPTDPGLIGAYGANQVYLRAADQPPARDGVEPEIFAPLTPEIVAAALNGLPGTAGAAD